MPSVRKGGAACIRPIHGAVRPCREGSSLKTVLGGSEMHAVSMPSRRQPLAPHRCHALGATRRAKRSTCVPTAMVHPKTPYPHPGSWLLRAPRRAA